MQEAVSKGQPLFFGGVSQDNRKSLLCNQIVNLK